MVSPANLVKNGGFECGLPPWTAGDVVNVIHKLSALGADGSATAFEWDQIGSPGPDSSRNPAFLTQDVSGLTAGKGYNLVFSVYFDACTSDFGFVGVRIGGQFGTTFNPCDRQQAAVGKFAQVTVSFTAAAATTDIRFEFVSGGKPQALIKIDQVAVTPA